jgi:hypothetical protein
MRMPCNLQCSFDIGTSPSPSFEIGLIGSRTLTQACGVKTFIMMDLVKPDAGRLRSILSGIMNFAKWRSVFTVRSAVPDY